MFYSKRSTHLSKRFFRFLLWMSLPVLNCRLNDALLEPMLVMPYFLGKATFFLISFLLSFISNQKLRSTELTYFFFFLLFFFAKSQAFTKLDVRAFPNYLFINFDWLLFGLITSNEYLIDFKPHHAVFLDFFRAWFSF